MNNQVNINNKCDVEREAEQAQKFGQHIWDRIRKQKKRKPDLGK